MIIDELLKTFKNRKASIMGEASFRKYAVLVPLVNVNGEIHVLFEVRAKHLRSQPGDICFPGGKMDLEDIDEKACAVRETSEELGVSSTEIRHVVPLDYVVSDTGRIIYPFVGHICSLDSLQINHEEVSEVFTVPLHYFQQTDPKRYKIHLKVQPEEDFPYDLIYNGEDYDWRTRGITEIFYQYNDYVIWGLTAKIITHFLSILQSEQIEES